MTSAWLNIAYDSELRLLYGVKSSTEGPKAIFILGDVTGFKHRLTAYLKKHIPKKPPEPKHEEAKLKSLTFLCFVEDRQVHNFFTLNPETYFSITLTSSYRCVPVYFVNRLFTRARTLSRWSFHYSRELKLKK